MKMLVLFIGIVMVGSLSCKEGGDKTTLADQIEKAISPVEATVTSNDGVKINYTQYGQGDHVILFVHGWSCDQTYWKEQIDHFREDYLVITIDLGGHGESGKGERKEWTIPSFSDDVLTVVKAHDHKDITLVGHSLGAMVVIEAGKTLPADKTKIVAVDYLKTPLVAFPIEVVNQFMGAFYTDFEMAMRGFVTPMFTEDSDTTIRDWIMDDMASAPPEIAIPSSVDLATRDFNSTFKSLIEKDISRYIINSDLAPTDFDYYKDSLGFSIITIPKSGHFMMLEKADEFNQQLTEILASD